MSRHFEWLDGDIAAPRVVVDLFHRLSPLNRRLRMEYLAGAERRSRRALGRPLTADELAGVLRRYPGDVSNRARATNPEESGEG